MKTIMLALVLFLSAGCCDDCPPCPDADGGIDTPDGEPDAPEPQCSEPFECDPADPVNCNCTSTGCTAVMVYSDVQSGLVLVGNLTATVESTINFGTGLRDYTLSAGAHSFALSLECRGAQWDVTTYVDGVAYAESLPTCDEEFRLTVTTEGSISFAPICRL